MRVFGDWLVFLGVCDDFRVRLDLFFPLPNVRDHDLLWPIVRDRDACVSLTHKTLWTTVVLAGNKGKKNSNKNKNFVFALHFSAKQKNYKIIHEGLEM